MFKSFILFSLREFPQSGCATKRCTFAQIRQYSALKAQTNSSLEVKPSEGNNITYLTKGDTLLSKVLLKVKSNKTRKKSNLMMLEGKRLIKDALSSGVEAVMIFFTRKKDLEEVGIISSDVKLYRTAYKELQLWSNLTTCPGIIAICKVPPPVEESEDRLPITVICDQIREPGNLGAIIRNSVGAGVSKLVLGPGCTDLWDSKVLRAASGAHFKIPIYKEEIWDMKKYFSSDSQVFLADSAPLDRTTERVNTTLPIIPYYEVDFTSPHHIGVVVGGETESLSEDAFKLAQEFCGLRVTIPLSNDLDSLNSSFALSILLFEIKRQIFFCSNNYSAKKFVSQNFQESQQMSS